jgi:mono/diheme cytochrome c family protein
MASSTTLSILPLLLCLAAAPAVAADVNSGQRIAARWCAACHMISPGQSQSSPDAPTFAAVAGKYDSKDLRLFLTTPYPRMPNMALSQPEIADLVAYIRTLGPKRDEPEPMEKDEKPPEARRG